MAGAVCVSRPFGVVLDLFWIPELIVDFQVLKIGHVGVRITYLYMQLTFYDLKS